MADSYFECCSINKNRKWKLSLLVYLGIFYVWCWTYYWRDSLWRRLDTWPANVTEATEGTKQTRQREMRMIFYTVSCRLEGYSENLRKSRPLAYCEFRGMRSGFCVWKYSYKAGIFSISSMILLCHNLKENVCNTLLPCYNVCTTHTIFLHKLNQGKPLTIFMDSDHYWIF